MSQAKLVYEPARVDLVIYRGDTWAMPVWLEDENGQPLDLTGCTALLQVRSEPDGERLLELKTPDDITLEPLTGKLTLRLPATRSAAIEWRRGVYDLQITHADGSVETPIAGEIAAEKDVSSEP